METQQLSWEDKQIIKRYGRDPVVIAKCKGDKFASRVIQLYEGLGYSLDNIDTRKQAYSLLTGVFTKQQIHTLVLRKNGKQPDARI